MKRLALVVLSFFVVAPGANADFTPGVGRGVDPAKVYQSGDVDAVDLQSGALSAVIPIGPRYPVTERLSYGLTLSYSSRAWDYEKRANESGTWYAVFPNRRSNAGVGWSLHMGLLISPADPTNQVDPAWRYVSPDGGEHRFFETLHDGEVDGDPPFPNGVVFNTRDNSYLRLSSPSTDVYEVEFPDGTIHKFAHQSGRPAHEHRLTQIRDRFAAGGRINIAYNDTLLKWTISDSTGRSQVVQFAPFTYDTPPDKPMVDYVDLAAFDGSPGRWNFTYAGEPSPPQIYRDCQDGDPDTTTQLVAPVLASVTQPDGTTWTFQHWDDAPGAPLYSCKQTVLSEIKLPTGGKIDYDYSRVVIPANDRCQTENDSGGVEVLALASRTFIDPIVQHPAQANAAWTYDYAITPSDQTTDFCPSPGTWEYWPPEEQIVTVETPLGDKSQHYFSVWPGGFYSAPHGSDALDWGLPFSRLQASSGGRFLSSRTFDCSATPGCFPCDAGQPPSNLCTVQRSEFVLYEHDTPPTGGLRENRIQINRRLQTQRTVYNDDGNVYAETAFSDFDGVGHYRQEAQSGTFLAGNSQTNITNFNPARGSYPGSYNPLLVSSPWLLETYDRSDVTGGTPQDTARKLYSFSGTTGFLDCIRTLKNGGSNPAKNAHDVLTRYTANAAGNIQQERTFGGEAQSLGTSGACSDSGSLSPEFSIEYIYASGARKSAQYVGQTFKSLDLDINPATGLPSASRDSAGVQINFIYDDLGRLKRSVPQTFGTLTRDAQTEYTYWATNGSAPASLEIETCAAHLSSCLASNRYTDEYTEVTGFGRPWHEVRVMPDTTDKAVRVTRYNSMGWKDRVSSWVYDADVSIDPETDLAATVYADYDPFGRPATVTLPDGKVTRHEYLGVEWVKTDHDVALVLGGADQCVRRWDAYDRQGRLFRVEEAYTACTGSATPTMKTEYGYDEEGRLVSVCENKTGSTCNQTRSFSYDNRGFLTSETHPEKGVSGNGTVTYSCHDSHGHAKYRDDGAASGRRLGFKYDGAERLVEVRVPTDSTCAAAPAGTVWKQFTYATSNGAGSADKGKLVTALRGNVIGSPYPANTVVNVTESYTYQGRQGRVSARATQVNRGGTNQELWTISQSYDELGNLLQQDYPVCTGGSCGGGSGTPSRSATFGYGQGLLESVSAFGSPWLSDLDYHASGMVSSVEHANGTTESIAIDATTGMARPKSITVSPAAGSSDPPWTSGDYAYDGAGNIKTMGAGGTQDQYRYDKFSRLVEAKLQAFSPLRQQAYTFDAYGNITSVLTDGTTTENFPVQGNTNRLSSTIATYDAGGNLTSWNGNAYGYDLFNAMTGLCTSGTLSSCPGERWTYVYTADDERLWAFRTDDSHHVWTARGLGNNLLTRDERTASGGFAPGAPLSLCPGGTPETRVFCDNFETGDTSGWSTATVGVMRVVTDYVWRNDKLTGAHDSAGFDRHYGLDHLGTVRAISNDLGDFVALHTYFPFGREATSAGQDVEVMKFTGHERDLHDSPAATADDLDYMHARFYGQLSGRFLSVDPARGNSANPQGWNRYSYVCGNPLGSTDPTGERSAAQIARDSQNALARFEQNISGLTTDGSLMGVLVTTQVKNVISVASAALDPLKAGDAVGTAVGSGAGPIATGLAIAQDALRTAGLVAPLAGAGRSVAAATAGHTLAEGSITVYRAVNSAGQVEYVGITNNLARRALEHLRSSGFRIQEVVSGLSRPDARGIEQALINYHGFAADGGTLLNRINSIARSNPAYVSAVARGQQLLNGIGY